MTPIDGELTIVHRDHASDRGRIGTEPPAPEAVAEDDGLPAVGRVLGGGEVAADCRLHAEHPEEVRRDPHAADPFGFAVRDQRRDPRPDERHVLERVAALAPVEERRVADVAGRSGRAALADRDEPIGIRVRQRAEQHGVEDAEDRGVRADAERQRHERDGREAGRTPKQPRGVADVSRQIDDQVRRPRRRRRRLVARRLQPSGAARTIGAGDLFGDPRAIGERCQRLLDRLGLRHAGRDQLRIVVGDVLRELVDDVAGTRRIDGQRVQPGADERLPVVHHKLPNPPDERAART